MANVLDDLLGSNKKNRLSGSGVLLSELKTEQTELLRRVDEIAKAYTALRNKLIDVAAKSERTRDIKKLDEFEARIDAISQELVSRGSQYADAETAIAKLSRDVRILIDGERKSRSQIKTLAEKLDDTELHNRISSLNEKVKLFTDVRETLVSSVNSIERRLNSLEKNTANFEREKIELIKTTGSLSEKFTKNVELSSRLHERCDALEEKVSQLADLSNTVSKELIDIRRGEGERTALKTEISETKSEIETSKSIEESLNERINAIESAYKEALKNLEKKLVEVETTAQETQTHKDKIEKLESGQEGLAEKTEDSLRIVRSKIDGLENKVKSIGALETVASSERVMSAITELGKRQNVLESGLEAEARRDEVLAKMRSDFDEIEELSRQNQHILAGLDAEDRLTKLERKLKEAGELVDELHIRSERDIASEFESKLQKETARLNETISTLLKKETFEHKLNESKEDTRNLFKSLENMISARISREEFEKTIQKEDTKNKRIYRGFENMIASKLSKDELENRLTGVINKKELDDRLAGVVWADDANNRFAPISALKGILRQNDLTGFVKKSDLDGAISKFERKVEVVDDFARELEVLRETRDILSDRLAGLASTVAAQETERRALIAELGDLKKVMLTRDDVKKIDKSADVKKITDAVRSEMRDLMAKMDKISAKVSSSTSELSQIEKETVNQEKAIEAVLGKVKHIEEAKPHASREKLTEIESNLRRISDVNRKMEEQLKGLPNKRDLKDLIELVENLLTHIGN